MKPWGCWGTVPANGQWVRDGLSITGQYRMVWMLNRGSGKCGYDHARTDTRCLKNGQQCPRILEKAEHCA